MGLLSRVGLVSPRSYWSKWRHAVVAILVLAMVVTLAATRRRSRSDRREEMKAEPGTSLTTSA